VSIGGNRQVIAYAFEEMGDRQRVAIYEPGCVCTEHALLVDLGEEKPVVVEHCPPGLDRLVTGLVCGRYEVVDPPAGALSRLQRSPRIRRLTWQLRHWTRRTGGRLLPS